MAKLLKLLQNYGIVAGFLIFCVYLSVATGGNFSSVDNLLDVANQISINAIIATGMTFVILTAGIDLSVGSVLGFCGIVAAIVLKKYGIPAGFAAGIGLGALLGAFNGTVITKLKITPFITTLAMMTMARGFAWISVPEGRPVSDFPESFSNIAAGSMVRDILHKVLHVTISENSILAVPNLAIIMVVVVAGAYFILTKTAFGRHVYSTGGNEEATYLSGVNVNRVKFLVYTISGLLSGFSGVLLASRLDTGHPNSGDKFELNAIAAVVLGGTSLMGGVGSVLGTFFGSIIIGVLDNGLLLLGVTQYNQWIIKGVVILLAVFLDQMKKR